MNLMEESFQKKEQQKKKKGTTIVLTLIVIVIIAIIALIIYISQIKSSSLKIYLDGSLNGKLENSLIIEEDGTVYARVKQIAPFLGYESFNGEYSEKSEQNNKCYVESKEEVCNFELGSYELYKLDLTGTKENYERCVLREKIKSIDGIICASSDAIEKAFNVNFEYDKDKNTITIETLPYLKESYSSYAMDKGYKEISDVLSNKKAMLDGMIVATKENKTMGVINSLTGEMILESKYTNIIYLPTVGDFIVEDNKKMGVLSKDRKTIISPAYDSIELLDVDSELYLVKQDNKYGVMDFRGNVKVFIENDEIGIDISKFDKNDLKNKYILAENLIPVKKNDLWGLFDKKGKQIVDYKYDSFGYISSTNKNTLNLLVIPGYDVIVACKDKKYTLLDSNGEELFAPVADDIYMTIEGNQKLYHINANNRVRSATEFLESRGITVRNNTINSNSNDTDNENTNTINSQENTKQNTENNSVNNNNNQNNTEESVQGDNNQQDNNEEGQNEE